jgi:hypothetical protein
MLCPFCKTVMKDEGMLEGFYEPYSPYLPYEILDLVDDVDSERDCVHLFCCPHCGYDQRYHCPLLTGPEFT